MQPTNELRFVERWSHEYQMMTRILQQKWVGEELNHMTGDYTLMQEWRDVPVEKECL